METKINIPSAENFNVAPIERAHLHRGFSSSKTPLKWIRFFRACVLEREYALAKKNRKIKNVWWSILAVIVLIAIILLITHNFIFIILVGIISLIIGAIITYRIKNTFDTKYTEGFDFFADYFSAFFSLIEEDLPLQSEIKLKADVRDTIKGMSFFKDQNPYKSTTPRFISGKENHYEKEISNGSCSFVDESHAVFKFTEYVREREIKKRGSSGKIKYKNKYKSLYTFRLNLSIPKKHYKLNENVNKNTVVFTETPDFYVIKTSKRFDIRNDNPKAFDPYKPQSITNIPSDYFALEIINLFNISFGCVKPI